MTARKGFRPAQGGSAISHELCQRLAGVSPGAGGERSGYITGVFCEQEKVLHGMGLCNRVVTLALGASLMEKADFGLSMVAAPAYLVYLKLSQVWGFVTFGMAEYMLQDCLLL